MNEVTLEEVKLKKGLGVKVWEGTQEQVRVAARF